MRTSTVTVESADRVSGFPPRGCGMETCAGRSPGPGDARSRVPAATKVNCIDVSTRRLWMSEPRTARNANNLLPGDEPAHDWYRFVLSYPPHLVRVYIEKFGLDPDSVLLDPFCGTGTTLVEAKRLGIPSVGVEAIPIAHLAARTKVDWGVDPDRLVEHAELVAGDALAMLEADGITDEPMDEVPSGVDLRTLPHETARLLLKNSISPLPLHKVLVLLDAMRERRDPGLAGFESVALAKVLPTEIGNLRFGPEVGVGPVKKDAAVVATWLEQVRVMAKDLAELAPLNGTPVSLHLGDAREAAEYLEPGSVDAVITSPPYPNEKDYTRTVRLESVLLGFIRDRGDLQRMKKSLLRSNTRGVYKGDDDDRWVSGNREIRRIAEAIEARRLELGKTSGFERMYHRVTKLYFGGMARHLHSLSRVLKPGARLAYVVGDQASYLRVMIRTGQLLAGVAEALGYEVEGIDLFRTRFATATGGRLREEVLLLRWPGT